MSSFLLTDRMTNHLTINDFPYFIEAARQDRASKGYHRLVHVLYYDILGRYFMMFLANKKFVYLIFIPKY